MKINLRDLQSRCFTYHVFNATCNLQSRGLLSYYFSEKQWLFFDDVKTTLEWFCKSQNTWKANIIHKGLSYSIGKKIAYPGYFSTWNISDIWCKTYARLLQKISSALENRFLNNKTVSKCMCEINIYSRAQNWLSWKKIYWQKLISLLMEKRVLTNSIFY